MLVNVWGDGSNTECFELKLNVDNIYNLTTQNYQVCWVLLGWAISNTIGYFECIVFEIKIANIKIKQYHCKIQCMLLDKQHSWHEKEVT